MDAEGKPEIGHHSHSGKSLRDPKAGERGEIRKSLPKKGGRGSQNWGAPGDEVNEAQVSEGDPNYDPSEEPGTFRVSSVEVPEDQAGSLIEKEILEYYDTADVGELGSSLAPLQFGNLSYLIINSLVLTSLDRTNTERELASVGIAEVVGRKIVSLPAVEQAFTLLLGQLGDLKLDIPNATEYLGTFVARAVADDCLAPAFVNQHAAVHGDFVDPSIRAAIKKGHTLLAAKHATFRLSKCWGPITGGIRPVETHIQNIADILAEYLSSEDADEAEQSLREMHVPHFHHRVVYEVIVDALEHGQDAHKTELLAALLARLGSSNNLITPDQMEMGFKRVLGSLADLVLDIPNARLYYGKFTELCERHGALPPNLPCQSP